MPAEASVNHRRAVTAAVLAAAAAAFLFQGGPRPRVVQMAAAPKADAGLARATFAGGCFWCMEPPFDKLEGVVSTTSGYTGGQVVRPSYEDVSMGRTGHTEAVQVVYDPARVSYEKLLEVFWRNVDPFDARGQFCDKGSQYRPAIFVHDAEQQRLAEESLRAVQARFADRKEKVVVPVVAAVAFYPAEDYHQDYYQKNPARYRLYRFGCGRDGRLEQVWGK
jgi:peptide-methionine (S)-S-oxide reductase